MKAPIEADRLNPMPSKIAGERGLIGAATDRPSPAQTSTRRLLGVRRERPCCRAVEQRDELATPHSMLLAQSGRSAMSAYIRFWSKADVSRGPNAPNNVRCVLRRP